MLNINLRILTTSDFGKNFFKLMNNSNFGKTIENIRKYRNIEFGCHRILVTKPLCNRTSNFELSKTLIYKFLYE